MQYLWTINFVFIALCSLFAAKSVGSVVASNIEPTVEPAKASRQGLSSKPKKEERSLDPISERNLLDAKKEVLEPPKSEPENNDREEVFTASANGELPPDDSMQDCSLLGTLIGTIAANEPEWSMVIYANKNDKEPQVFGMTANANTIEDTYTIKDIRPKSVVVINSEGAYELCVLGKEYDKKGKAKSAAAVTTASNDAPKDDVGTNVQKIDDFNYSVEKGEVDKIMNNLSTVASQARMVPNFKNGKSNGFKIFSIRPGSIFGKLGLKNGDIIQKVNGYELNSPDKALELYQKLKDTSNLGVEIIRHGKNENINVSIH